MQFSTAIFDMDGTLFDTERIAIDALQQVFGDHGVEVARQALVTVIGAGVKEAGVFLSRFTPPGVGIEEILKLTGSLIKVVIEAHGLPLKTGALELLTHLKERDVAIGLATSTNTDHALDNLKRSNLTGFFQCVIGGDQVERGKPHPEIYLKALTGLQSDAGTTIALEDSDHGILSAYAAGLRVIHVPDIKRIDAQTMGCVYREFASLLAFKEELAA